VAEILADSLSLEVPRGAGSPTARPGSATGDGDGYRVWLYSRDGEDSPVSLEELPELGDTDLLWADVDLDCAEGLDRLWTHLDIGGVVARLRDLGGLDQLPALHHHGHVLQLTVLALGDDAGAQPMPLHCLVGSNWVVTLHSGELDLVDGFNQPLHGETQLGELDGPRFLSLVLDWQLSGYFTVIEELRDEIDRLDETVLQPAADEDDLLGDLLELRRRVRRLRGILGPHRGVLGLLSHPESAAVIGTESADVYQRVEMRLQQALDESDTLRETLVGSFDILMTRTAQATNDIMKRLTLVSVLLLPAGVLAGIMGMNFQLGFFERSWLFWVVIAVMVTTAAATLVVARRRRWI
jgi:Mg2+ and Co2+ transporter CorA